MLSRSWRVLGIVVLLAVLFPRDAFAYIDPGSGSLIFQTIVATLAGVAYGVRVYWSRIRGLFGRRAPDSSTPEEIAAAERRTQQKP